MSRGLFAVLNTGFGAECLESLDMSVAALVFVFRRRRVVGSAGVGVGVFAFETLVSKAWIWSPSEACRLAALYLLLLGGLVGFGSSRLVVPVGLVAGGCWLS